MASRKPDRAGRVGHQDVRCSRACAVGARAIARHRMANHHFGKLADVWKHAVLLEVLDREPPARYGETHAGSGAYPLARDAERRFGVFQFLEAAPGFAALAHSTYRAQLMPFVGADPAVYPGSALLAMTLLGDKSSYLLCDLDPHSAADLRRHAHALDLGCCEIVERDGMLATAAWLDNEVHVGSPRSAVVHVDPFDPHARAAGGSSALELGARIAERGARLVYWYGYDQPSQRAWAHDELARLTTSSLWCGDVMITDANGAGREGDLGRATTPGTGFGIVLANVGPDTIRACTELGAALVDAYAATTLPDGTRGGLAFTTRASPTGTA